MKKEFFPQLWIQLNHRDQFSYILQPDGNLYGSKHNKYPLFLILLDIFG